jgi:hypothetical protein
LLYAEEHALYTPWTVPEDQAAPHSTVTALLRSLSSHDVSSVCDQKAGHHRDTAHGYPVMTTANDEGIEGFEERKKIAAPGSRD